MSWEVTSSTLTGWVNFTKEVLLQEGGDNQMYPLRRMFQRVKMDFSKDQRLEHSIFKKSPGSSVRGLQRTWGSKRKWVCRGQTLRAPCLLYKIQTLSFDDGKSRTGFQPGKHDQHITFTKVTPLVSCCSNYQEVEVEAGRLLHTAGELRWNQN